MAGTPFLWPSCYSILLEIIISKDKKAAVNTDYFSLLPQGFLLSLLLEESSIAWMETFHISPCQKTHPVPGMSETCYVHFITWDVISCIGEIRYKNSKDIRLQHHAWCKDAWNSRANDTATETSNIMTAHNSRKASNSRNESNNKIATTPPKAGMLAKTVKPTTSWRRPTAAETIGTS